MTTTTYPIGTLSTPTVHRSTYLNTIYTQDVYSFNITGTRSINLDLHNISVGDDADLRLFRDTNNNGRLDSGDQLLLSSRRSSNADDSINYVATTGRYLAVVDRYSLGPDNRLTYNLDLSATPPTTTNDLQIINLLPRETIVGTLNGTPRSFNGSISGTNTSDTYAFSLRTSRPLTNPLRITLTGLTQDADIRLIQDRNRNQIVDPGEVIASSKNSGTSAELITRALPAGDYFVQVYQYTGNTNYHLTIS